MTDREGWTSVFGYGSLIWKSPPWQLDSTPGYIKNHVRRFAQASHDHRGTPEAPGRVVTLVTEEDWEQHRKDDPLGSHHVWGRVYYIPPDLESEIWAYLDHREKDGYSLRTVDVYGVDSTNGDEIVVQTGVRVYVGETHNPSFVGGELMRQLAHHIAHACGPSGPNKEYVYNLAEAVRRLCPASEDAYLARLERLVREYDPEPVASSAVDTSIASHSSADDSRQAAETSTEPDEERETQQQPSSSMPPASPRQRQARM